MTRVVARGRVAGLYTAPADGRRQDAFVSTRVETLSLGLSGIAGDLHAGATRKAGAREPWLPRGTILRNDRQISALGCDELASIAAALGVAALAPEWIGGNLLVDGITDFSRIAPGSRLASGGSWQGKGRFDGGVVLRVEGYNAPCRQAGRAVARACGRPELELAFVKAAKGLRGLVLSVDRAGSIATGDDVILLAPMSTP